MAANNENLEGRGFRRIHTDLSFLPPQDYFIDFDTCWGEKAVRKIFSKVGSEKRIPNPKVVSSTHAGVNILSFYFFTSSSQCKTWDLIRVMLWYRSFWIQRWGFFSSFLMAPFIKSAIFGNCSILSASTWRQYLDHGSYELDADVRDWRRIAPVWVLSLVSLCYTPFKPVRMAKTVPLAMVPHRNGGILFILLAPNMISYPPLGIAQTNRQSQAKLRYPSAAFKKPDACNHKLNLSWVPPVYPVRYLCPHTSRKRQ